MKFISFVCICVFLSGCYYLNEKNFQIKKADERLWSEFLDHYRSSRDLYYNCFYLKGYFDLYSSESTFRVRLEVKQRRPDNLFFLQFKSITGAAVFLLEQTKDEIFFYSPKENRAFVADRNFDIFSYFNLSSPFSLGQILQLIKGNLSSVFEEGYTPLFQHEEKNNIVFLFSKTSKISSISLDKGYKNVTIEGRDPVRWYMEIKNPKKVFNTTVYRDFTLKYNRVRLHIKVKKIYFTLDPCNIINLRSVLPKHTPVILLKEEKLLWRIKKH